MGFLEGWSVLSDQVECLIVCIRVPRRWRVAVANAITRSKVLVSLGGAVTHSDLLKKLNASGSPSSFQAATIFPRLESDSVSASWEPMASPSGRTWLRTAMVRALPTSSAIGANPSFIGSQAVHPNPG